MGSDVVYLYVRRKKPFGCALQEAVMIRGLKQRVGLSYRQSRALFAAVRLAAHDFDGREPLIRPAAGESASFKSLSARGRRRCDTKGMSERKV